MLAGVTRSGPRVDWLLTRLKHSLSGPMRSKWRRPQKRNQILPWGKSKSKCRKLVKKRESRTLFEIHRNFLHFPLIVYKKSNTITFLEVYCKKNCCKSLDF